MFRSSLELFRASRKKCSSVSFPWVHSGFLGQWDTIVRWETTVWPIRWKSANVILDSTATQVALFTREFGRMLSEKASRGLFRPRADFAVKAPIATHAIQHSVESRYAAGSEVSSVLCPYLRRHMHTRASFLDSRYFRLCVWLTLLEG